MQCTTSLISFPSRTTRTVVPLLPYDLYALLYLYRLSPCSTLLPFAWCLQRPLCNFSAALLHLVRYKNFLIIFLPQNREKSLRVVHRLLLKRQSNNFQEEDSLIQESLERQKANLNSTVGSKSLTTQPLLRIVHVERSIPAPC